MANVYKRLNYDPIGGASSAAGVSYDNTDSGLDADNVQDAIDEVVVDLGNETTARQNADTTLQTNIDNEQSARITADDLLQDNIDAEESARIAADNLLIPLAQKGQPNGVATLDGAGLIPSTQLPSYVDDVLEYANLAAFPVTGETGKIYIARDTNFQYRWSGSAYFQLSVSPVSSVFNRTGAVIAVSGDYTASQVTNVPAGNIVAVTVQSAINELDSVKFASADFNSTFDTRLSTKSTTDLAEGTNQYFTDERAQDAIGTILTDTTDINLTYNDAGNTISADLTLSGVIADTYGSISTIPQITIDSKGRITSATEFNISINTGDIPNFTESVEDTIGNILVNTQTVDLSYNDTTPSISADVRFSNSITSTVNGLELENDQASPGNSKYYGTDSSGVRGYFSLPTGGSSSDIQETSFSLTNNQTTLTDITAFIFPNVNVRSFQALVSVSIDATSDLFEEFHINGIQLGSDWQISIDSTGDDSGVNFDITAGGQVQYTSNNYSGFSTGTIKFRAITTAA